MEQREGWDPVLDLRFGEGLIRIRVQGLASFRCQGSLRRHEVRFSAIVTRRYWTILPKFKKRRHIHGDACINMTLFEPPSPPATGAAFCGFSSLQCVAYMKEKWTRRSSSFDSGLQITNKHPLMTILATTPTVGYKANIHKFNV
jgi:hypothetical protein